MGIPRVIIIPKLPYRFSIEIDSLSGTLFSFFAAYLPITYPAQDDNKDAAKVSDAP
ncbi:MAG: hypothetical protein ACJATI_004244 [Halioglobus sp.]|jgi:hypothetical protein